jgi:uncharacterized protein YgiM (DUF1202 family)
VPQHPALLLRSAGALLLLTWFAAPGQAQAPDTSVPARWVPAHPDNYSRATRARSVEWIVIHTIEGSEAAGVSWFQDPRARVSSHYVVSDRGRVTQMVRERDRAWHAGSYTYNQGSIGIENEGYAGRDGWTDAQVEALAALTRDLCDRYGIPKDRRHLIGHSEVPGASHGDPGSYFPWARFLDLVRADDPDPPAPSPAPPDLQVIEVSADVLNVRRERWGTILGQVTRGQRLVAREQENGWWRIDWSGRSAWLSGSYVRRVSDERVVYTESALEALSAPRSSAPPRAVVDAGQAYVEVARERGWIQIDLGPRTAWVRSEHVLELEAP